MKPEVMSELVEQPASVWEALRVALEFHDPELLRAFVEHDEGRPIPELTPLGNSRKAA